MSLTLMHDIGIRRLQSSQHEEEEDLIETVRESSVYLQVIYDKIKCCFQHPSLI